MSEIRTLKDGNVQVLPRTVSDAVSMKNGNSVEVEINNKADRELSNLSDYQKGLHNIGGRPNRNLIINHRMIGTGNPGSFPVNQKGQKVYTPALNETTIDGWKIEITDPGTAKVEIKDGFVTITNTSQTSGIQFKQIVPIEALSAGGEYTISSYIKEVSADVFCILAMTDSPYINPIRIEPVPNEIVSGTVTALPQVSSGSYKFIYEIPSGGFVTIADQKLEAGPIQTLGWTDADGNVHLFDDMDYGEELARCQRYCYIPSTSFAGPQFRYYGGSENRLVGILPFPVQMRTSPVLSGFPITFRDTDNGQYVVIDSAQYFICDTGLTLWWQLNTTSGTFVDGHLYTVTSAIKFSAEL